MKSTFSIIFYLKRQVVKKDGTVPISESVLQAGRISRTDPSQKRYRLRPDPGPGSGQPRHFRPHRDAEDHRDAPDLYHRQGIGDTPDLVRNTSVQLGFCRGQRRGSIRHSRTVRPDRRRLGARRGAVPDRSCHDGGRGI